jgi:hypothetical protein
VKQVVVVEVQVQADTAALNGGTQQRCDHAGNDPGGGRGAMPGVHPRLYTRNAEHRRSIMKNHVEK